MNLSTGNDQAQVLDFFHVKFTFLNVQVKAGLLKLDEDCSYMLFVLLPVLTEDQDVVNVSSGKNIQAVSQNIIDVVLKRAGSSTKFKGHD